MNTTNRKTAVGNVMTRTGMTHEEIELESTSLESFGEDVFNEEIIRQYLPKQVSGVLLKTIRDGVGLSEDIAGDVAHAMKQWAIDRGATHFTHWFQPLTGSTAEKHDAFLEFSEGRPLFAFSKKNLIVGEPDASSFPSGGIRSTFEARGYTAWDPTSPAFIKRHANGATLCIPTAFCSYTGEALDKKTPLLRSVQALSKSVKRLMAHFGKPEGKVTVTLGAEQEYFLIDKEFYLNRPDLLQTGRTLLGVCPAKHQQLEDHYFGAIKPRVLSFMTDVQRRLWKLGVPAKTRHNEVAPAQFELATIFSDVNLAIDQNMIVMEVLKQEADKHNLVCLFHEKPFKGVNGSGKHNNWAIAYDGVNLLEPGESPLQNAIFLTVLCAIMRALNTHGDLMRASVASAGNDHRLGANEAPPAIMSMYLGDELQRVISAIESEAPMEVISDTHLKMGVDTIPYLPKDSTDRNRTSPFAFTGNKFEFRAPGSSQSCAGPMMALNTIVAESIDALCDTIEAFGEGDFLTQLQGVLQQTIKDNKRIVFNGDNYTQEWREEAERRGLPNLKDTPEALEAFRSDKNQRLFEKYGVLSSREVKARFEVFMEEYYRRLMIEAKILRELVRSQVIPAVVIQYGRGVKSLACAERSGVSGGIVALKLLSEELGDNLDHVVRRVLELESFITSSPEGEFCEKECIRLMEEVRGATDALELMVDDEAWPLPKYREMLFIY